MKFALFILMFCASVSAQNVWVSEHVIDPTNGNFYVIVGEQFPDTICQLQESGDTRTWNTSATWACHPDYQLVGASFPDWQPQEFVRSLNLPCGFEPAAADLMGPVESLTPAMLSFRMTIRGSVYRLGSLPAPLIPRFDGVRRFCLIPDFPRE